MWLQGAKSVTVDTEVKAPRPLPARYLLRRGAGQPPDLAAFELSPLRLHVALARAATLSSDPAELLLNWQNVRSSQCYSLSIASTVWVIRTFKVSTSRDVYDSHRPRNAIKVRMITPTNAGIGIVYYLPT